MEPLQEIAVEFIVQEEEVKNNMAQTQAECVEIISEEITVQVLNMLIENTMQAQTKAR